MLSSSWVFSGFLDVFFYNRQGPTHLSIALVVKCTRILALILFGQNFYRNICSETLLQNNLLCTVVLLLINFTIHIKSLCYLKISTNKPLSRSNSMPRQSYYIKDSTYMRPLTPYPKWQLFKVAQPANLDSLPF